MCDPARKRVLVVDDDRMVLDLITTRLDLAGYQTFFARDGFEGLARLYELRPDALAIELGARDYLTKPFRDDQLIARVGRLLHKRPASRPGSSLAPILL